MLRTVTLISSILLVLGCSYQPAPNQTTAGIRLLEQHQPEPGEIGISYQKYQLANGLTLLLHEDHSDPLVHVDVTYHVGSAREEAGKSGFAHFFEHMMFEGSQHAPAKLHWQIVNAAGGNMNGSTNHDFTRYYNRVPNNQLEKILWLEADRMGFLLPAVTQKKFEIQRDTVKNERAQRIDNQPYGRVGETISQALYPQGHPYSWPVIGWVEDLDRVDVNDLKAFFQTWYGPQNAVLTIGGDIDVATTLRWVEKYFGAIPEGQAIPDAQPQPATLSSDRYITLEDKISLPLLQFSFPTVSPQHPDEAPLDMLAEALGQGRASLFYQTFVESGLAVQAGVSHPCSELACNFNLYLVANPASDITLPELAQLVEEKLAEFSDSWGDEQALQRSKNAYRADTIFSLQSVSGKVRQLANNETFFGTPDTIAYDLERYGRVQHSDVERVFRQYIQAKPKLVLSVVPKGMAATAAYPPNFALPAPLSASSKPVKPVVWQAPKEAFARSQIPPAAAAPVITVPTLHRTKLENGIPLMTAYADETPTISMQFTLQGGANLETPDKAGVAALTAQMLAQSTTQHSAAELDELLLELGSSIHFSADYDASYISVFSLVDRLDETLGIVKEFLFQPGFKRSEFERLKQQQLQMIDNDSNYASSLASMAINQLNWGRSSRSGIMSEGNLQSVTSITLEDVKAYYQRAYSPEVSSVVAVGALSVEVLSKKLAFLQQWQGKAPTAPLRGKRLTASRIGKIYLVDKPGAAQGVVRVVGSAPGYDATGEYFKTKLANFALGGSFGARLNQVLRQERGYTYGVNSYLSSGRKSSYFVMETDVRADVVGEAVAETIAIMHRYQLNGPNLEEIAEMRSAASQAEALSYETPGQKAGLLWEVQYYGLSDDFAQQQQTIIGSISQQELTQLAQKHLNPEQMFVVVVGDAKLLRPQLQANLDWPIIDWKL